MTVTCACGTVGERGIADGILAPTLNRLGWVCPACTEREELEDAARAERDRYTSREKFSSVPLGLRHTLDELELTSRNAEAIAAARSWTAGELPGLLLTGPVGTGKTWIAAAAVWERQLRKPVRWASVPTMLANALRAFDDEERAGAIDAISGKGALALDDLDKVKPSEWVASQLFSAIDSRVAAGRPLLITMNSTPGEIETRLGPDFGEAICSRLIGYCKSIVLDGADRRLAGS